MVPLPNEDLAFVPATQDRSARKSRLSISTETSEKAKGATRTVIELLNVAATMTQSVPYLGAISTALSEFVKIQDEVDVCKDECRLTMDNAYQINTLIKGFRDKCADTGKGNGIFSEELQLAFMDLERIVLDSVAVLVECKLDSPTLRSRLRLYTRRSDLTRQVRECSEKMSKALQLFQMTLQVHQLLMLEDIRDAVRDSARLRDLSQGPSDHAISPVLAALSRTAYATSLWERATAQLPAAPALFYGRDEEVAQIVQTVTHEVSARVAILGPGGIGKTSIALAVLHHPDIKARYATHRCFLSCEPATSAEDVWRNLSLTFGLDVEGEEPLPSRLISELRPLDGIICLDNLETPWETDTAKIENLLVELASLPKVALMITSRLTDTPLINWSYPLLKPIAPLAISSALELWSSICHGYDEYSQKLCEAVDCVPLAVTLLARLARTETTKIVWSRWEAERITFVRSFGKEHRLNSLSQSIKLSLHMLNNEAAIDVLRLLSIFPEGLPCRYIPLWEQAFRGRLSIRDVITQLKHHSLLQHVENQNHSFASTGPTSDEIRILSPIRHYMLQHYEIRANKREHLFVSLADVFCNLQGRRFPHNLDNATIYLELGLAHGATRERCLQTIVYSHQSTCHLFYPAKLLLLALKTARTHSSPTEGPLCLRLAIMWRRKRRYRRALEMIHAAIQFDLGARHISDEIIYYAELAWANVDAAKHHTGPYTGAPYVVEAQMALEVLEKHLTNSPDLKVVDTGALHRAIAERRRLLGHGPGAELLDPCAMGPYSMEPAAGGYNSARVPVVGFSV
ncbi:hypothetical protein PENSPDRAFT_748217 [Peniophora sp. CONT]|nr:hypothetical protein PENSPDRAFT_748217 [Peniophora sp. CONT]